MPSPGASTFATPPPPPTTPPTIPTPAEQNQIDLQNTIDKSNAKELFCDSLDSSAPLELSTECDCYRTSIEFIHSDLQKWAEYNKKNEAYDNYIDDKKAWDQAKSDEKERLKNYGIWGKCGFVATPGSQCANNSPKGDWENNYKTTSGCSVGPRWRCRYTPGGIERRLGTWQNDNSAPEPPQNPVLPDDISAANFQCCINLTKDVRIEKSAQILQSCSQEINSALPPDERDEAEDYEQGLEDAAINIHHDITNRAKERGKTNITLIIIISVTIVILIIIVVLLLIYSRKQTPSLKVD